MNNVAAINEHLSKLFANGRPEVGLEVGADAGLDPAQYIQIPRSMCKRWAYRRVGANGHARVATDTTQTLTGKQGWTVVSDNSSRVIVTGGRTYVRAASSTSGTGDEVDDIYVDTHTYDDVRRFIVANTGHVRDGELKVEQVFWVHAARFWSVVTGLVTGSKQEEFKFVDDPTTDLSVADQYVDRIMSFQNEALTAIAARATSWRKSNHATGGDIASGFPRRWLIQQKLWPSTGDRATIVPVQKQLTTAFYVATHAAGVHNALALMSPQDEGHWACIDPRCGLMTRWEVKESTALRMTPKTQVAGTAMVVDAMVVLKMLVAESLAPLLENINQWQALRAQLSIVEEGGVAVASYASWFLDGHPNKYPKRAFNQKDSSCADLIGELGAVATRYYAKSTIGQSLALENAMGQLASETSKTRWAQLAKEKSSSTNATAVRAYRRITGASSGRVVADMASEDREVVTTAVAGYNELLATLSSGLGMGSAPQVNLADIFKQTPPDSMDEAEGDATVA